MILGELLLGARLSLLHRVRVDAILPGTVAYTWRPVGHPECAKLGRARHWMVGHVVACRNQGGHVRAAKRVDVVVHRIVVMMVRARRHLHYGPGGCSCRLHDWRTGGCEHVQRAALDHTVTRPSTVRKGNGNITR